MKKLLLYTCFLFVGTFVFAQEKDALLDEYDVIRKKSRDTSISPEKAKILAHEYLDKAKKSGEKQFIGRGYYLLARKIAEFQEKIQYLDSAIYYTKDLKNDFQLPMQAYFIKGTILDHNEDYEKALENYALAQKEALENDNEEYQYYIKYNIGFLKRVLGDYEEAELLFKECLNYEETKTTIDVTSSINIMLLLSSIYFESDKIEACSTINKRGIRFTLDNNRLDFYYNFVVHEGINLTKKEAYKAAIDSLEKGRVHLDKKSQLVTDFYLGKSYYAIGRKQEALYNFKQIDTFFTKTNYLSPPLRESYVYLIKDAKDKGDKESQLYYTDQLLKINDVVHAEYKLLSKNIKDDYDIPKLLIERDELIEILKQGNIEITQKNKWIIVVSVLFCLLMLGGFIYNYRLKKKYEKRYNEIITQSNSIIEEEISVKNVKPQAVSLGIDQHIIEEVLQALETFEQGEAYLKNQISLKDVAKIVNTNSKYLSKIVNSYKNKNFTTYINDLRIDYLVSYVQTDTKYQKYTIRAIAEEIGFSNPEGFSRAFQKKTGLKPSYFIKKVRENTKKKQ